MSALRTVSRKTFSSLAIRNYRLFFFGQLVSLCGTWMQTVAVAWLVLQLTGSGVAVGTVVAAQFLPTLLFGVWGGVIADRVDKRRALIATQAAMASVAAVLAAVTAADVIELWMVYACTVLLGFANLVDNPTRQAFVTEMVGPGEVANAVGLNSAVFNAARVVGPAIAGGLIVGVGIWPAFAVNAVSFVAVIAGLVAMRPNELHRVPPVARAKGQVRDGLRYVRRSPVLLTTLLLVAAVGTFAMNFTITMPLLVRYTFGREADAFGLLTSAAGIGSMAGALVAAARARPSHRFFVGSCLAFGVAMLAAAAAPTFAVELAVMPVLGACTISFMATGNSILQLNSRPDMRGRVMALYALVFLGTTPVGGPVVGWVAEQWGPRMSVALGGVACLVAGGVTALVLRRAGAAALVPAAGAAGVPVGSPAGVVPDRADVTGAVPEVAPVPHPAEAAGRIAAVARSAG